MASDADAEHQLTLHRLERDAARRPLSGPRAHTRPRRPLEDALPLERRAAQVAIRSPEIALAGGGGRLRGRGGGRGEARAPVELLGRARRVRVDAEDARRRQERRALVRRHARRLRTRGGHPMDGSGKRSDREERWKTDGGLERLEVDANRLLGSGLEGSACVSCRVQSSGCK